MPDDVLVNDALARPPGLGDENRGITAALHRAAADQRNITLACGARGHGAEGRHEVFEDDGVGLREGWESAETLGLQLVKDLVDQLRGSMTVDTGVGTRFLITFKIAKA